MSDYDKIIFLTPSEIDELGVGINTDILFNKDEKNEQFPILLESLKSIIKNATIGSVGGSDVCIDVENSNCKIHLCISINGKLYMLQNEEIPFSVQIGSIPTCDQIRIFQRLISEHQITLDDLAADDIDTDVYKTLVINDMIGEDICTKKIEYLENMWEEQQKDPTLAQKSKNIINML